ncbi:conserved membrane hypothetical protein [uncultured Paludibacter sp.]|uniref:EamA domain-containing protein n=1 Tax=uncultured Paludibacter sp. TaxID=497635 RepID=A0A653AD70_9BACT|nr:conserved membrane hypothetical protein [uncultured Paludibacter sp.]
MNLTKRAGHLSLFVANFIFGLNNPLTRTLIPDTISPFTLTIFRMMGAAALFWTASLFVKKEKIPRKDIVKLFFAALFGIVLNQMVFLEGLSITSPIDASLVVTLLPIVTMVLAAFIIREPITWLKIMGVIVGACGAMLLIFNSSASGKTGNFRGDLIILISTFSFAFYLTMFKDLISRYSPIHTMKWMFLFATLVSYPFCHSSLMQTNFAAFDYMIYLKIFYVVFFATFIAYLLIPIGQKTLRPTTLSMYNYEQPIVASLATIMIGLDKLSYENVLSAVLVFAGVYIVTQSKSRAQVEAEKEVGKK